MPGTGIIHDQGAYVNDYAIQPLACASHLVLGLRNFDNPDHNYSG
jgi:hypothetical protein